MENLSVSRAHRDSLCYSHRAHNLPKLSHSEQKDAPLTNEMQHWIQKKKKNLKKSDTKVSHTQGKNTVRINHKIHQFVVEEGSKV